MVLKRLFLEVRDIFSYCGIGFLVLYGWQTAFAYPGMTLVRQHRWLGYWILASAFAVADRIRTARRDVGAKREQALAR
jgi:hypothetical protein